MKFFVLASGHELLSVGVKRRTRNAALMSGHDDPFVRFGQVPYVYGTCIRCGKMGPVGAKHKVFATWCPSNILQCGKLPIGVGVPYGNLAPYVDSGEERMCWAKGNCFRGVKAKQAGPL